MKRSNIINEKLLDSIICTAYGDAGIAERIKVYFFSLRDARVKELLKEYRQTAVEIHSYKNMECPDEITKSAFNEIHNKEIKHKSTVKYIQFAYARPLLALSMSLIIIVVVSLFMLKRQNEEKRYSKAEIIQAEAQVKQSLAIVGRVFRKTENKLTEDVLEKRVTPPIKKSFDTINNLLNGG